LNGIRRRLVSLVMGVAALTPMMGATPANAIFFVGTCELQVVFHFTEPIGFATTGNPSYWIEVAPLVNGVMPCQITDKVLDPLRNTGVTANGTSSVWNCDAALGGGAWSQSWWHANGSYSPAPVNGGRHTVAGTWDNWILEAQGPNPVNFAGVIPLRLNPGRAAAMTAKCSNGTAWELYTIGTLVFQDPTV
jgi:hypothetical protein